MQQAVLAQETNDSGKTAGVIEVLHQKASGGHEVDYGLNLAAQFVPIAQGKLNAGSSRDGEQNGSRRWWSRLRLR